MSLLFNVGLNDLAADTDDEYVQRAVGLALDASRLRLLRATLRERVEGGAIMDGQRFARALETLYASIWEAYCGKER